MQNYGATVWLCSKDVSPNMLTLSLCETVKLIYCNTVKHGLEATRGLWILRKEKTTQRRGAEGSTVGDDLRIGTNHISARSTDGHSCSEGNLWLGITTTRDDVICHCVDRRLAPGNSLHNSKWISCWALRRGAEQVKITQGGKGLVFDPLGGV